MTDKKHPKPPPKSTHFTTEELRARFGPSFVAADDPVFLEGLNVQALFDALVYALNAQRANDLDKPAP